MNDSDSPIPTFEELSADPEIAALLSFEPAPRQNKRRDGWTPALQRRFIAQLAQCGSPNLAADAVGKNRYGVEKVYKSEGAESFAAAWDAAVALFDEREAKRREAQHAQRSAVQPPGTDRRRGDQSAPPPTPRPPLPVVCDACAAFGIAGDEAFAGIPDILAFDPVPLPFHDKGWDEERQRAFIAALAVTGSANRAAKSVGRHAMGAEKLKKMRGARGFAEAWEAALEIARERELNAMGPSLRELAGTPDDSAWHPDGTEVTPEEDEAMREQLVQKLLRLGERVRQDQLAEIRDDPEKRNAYEVLHGPQDWDAEAHQDFANRRDGAA